MGWRKEEGRGGRGKRKNKTTKREKVAMMCVDRSRARCNEQGGEGERWRRVENIGVLFRRIIIGCIGYKKPTDITLEKNAVEMAQLILEVRSLHVFLICGK